MYYSYNSNYPTATATAFFRGESSNVDLIAANIMPNVAPEMGVTEPLRIAHVGCSTGEETWVVAALLATRGRTKFSIDAIDANPDVLEKARRPYKRMGRAALIKACTDEYPFPLSSLDWIQQVDERTIRLDPELAGNIRYYQRNLLFDPMPGPDYDVAIMNNVLLYYYASSSSWLDRPRSAVRNIEHSSRSRPAIERLFGTVVHSLKPGGLFACEVPGQPQGQQLTDLFQAYNIRPISAAIRHIGRKSLSPER